MLPTSLGLCLCGGGFFISVQRPQKYIAEVSIGYKTDFFMVLQISRTHAKRNDMQNRCSGARRKWLASMSAPQQLPLHKNGFGLASLQHKSTLTVLHGLKQS